HHACRFPHALWTNGARARCPLTLPTATVTYPVPRSHADSEVVGTGGQRLHMTLSDEINDFHLVADMYHNWLERHPQERGTDASAVILRVLLEHKLATSQKVSGPRTSDQGPLHFQKP